MARKVRSQNPMKPHREAPWFTSGQSDKGPPMRDNPNTPNAHKIRAIWERDYKAPR